MDKHYGMENFENNNYYTLGELLQLNSMQGVKLLAGQTGLLNRVERTSVVEVSDLATWSDPGDLVLTSGYVFRNNETELAEQILKLSLHHVSGLCIKASPSGQKLSPLVIQKAEQLGFPLLELPMTAVFTSIVQESMEEILAKKIMLFQEVQTMTDSLLQAMWTENSPEQALSVLEKSFHNPIVIYNDENALLLTEKSKELLNEELQEELIRQLYSHASSGRLSFQEKDQTRSVPFYVFDIGTSEALFLVFIEYNRSMRPIDQNILGRIGPSFALEIKNALAVKKVRQKYKQQFVTDLLSGFWGDDMLGICVTAQNNGFDLKSDHLYRIIVLNLKIAAEENFFSQKEVNIIRHIIRNLGREILFGIQQGKLILIMEEEENWDLMLQKLLLFADKLNYIMAKGELYFCVSDPGELRSIPELFTQAMTISRISEHCVLRDQVVTHEKLGALYLLSMIPNGDIVQAYKEKYLGPLRKYDSIHHSNLFATLQTYLDTNCNKLETAEQLFTHYNTIVYRISRIESLLNMSLNDVENQFLLRIAFKLDLLD